MSDRPSIDIVIEADGWAPEDDLERLVERARAGLDAEIGGFPEPSAASVVFLDDAAVRDLNARFRGQDKPTNVLSFPAVGPARAAGLLGDVVLARETVRREADDGGLPFDHHLVHLIMHGLLHLIGHDHDDDAKARLMEGIETRALARLGIADPHRDREEAA